MKAATPSATTSAVRGIETLIEVLLAGLLVFLPAAFGTTDAASERVACWIGGAMAVALAVRVLLDRPRLPSAATAAVITFLALLALQLTPLPRGIIELISPATVQERADYLGDLPDAREHLSRMTLSFYPLASRHDIRVVLLATTVLAAVVIVYRTPRRIRRLLAIIALVGVGLGALTLAQDISGTNAIYWRVDVGEAARSGPFRNHSHFGQFMNLCIGAALALLLSFLYDPPTGRRRWPHMAWLGGAIVLGVLTISLSFTRGGVLAMLAAGAVTVLLLLTKRNVRWMSGVIVGLAVVTLFVLMYYGFDRVLERMTDTRGATGRIQMDKKALAIVRRFPALGVGLGTFEWVYPAYDTLGEASVASHAENEFVQAAVETGWVGFAAMAAFVMIVWCAYVRAVRGQRFGIAAIGLGYGLLAVMIQSLSDFGQHMPSVACLSAAVCGLILNLGDLAGRPAGSIRIGRLISGPLLIIVLGVTVWSIVGAERAARAEALWPTARTMARTLARRDWDASAQEFADLRTALDATVAAEPENAHNLYWSAVYHWHMLSTVRDPQTGRMAADAKTVARALGVVSMLNEARRQCPTYGSVYSVLGQIEHNFLGRGSGISHLRAATRLDPNDPTTFLVIGEIDARRGQLQLAEAELRRAMDLDSSLVGDVLDFCLHELGDVDFAAKVAEPQGERMLRAAEMMRVDQIPREKWQRILERSLELRIKEGDSPSATKWQLASVAFQALGMGKFEIAERFAARAVQADPTSADLRVTHARTLSGLGRFEEAISELRVARNLDPGLAAAKELLEKLTGTKAQ